MWTLRNRRTQSGAAAADDDEEEDDGDGDNRQTVTQPGWAGVWAHPKTLEKCSTAIDRNWRHAYKRTRYIFIRL